MTLKLGCSGFVCLQCALEQYTVGTKGAVCFFSRRNQSLVVHLRKSGKS